MPQPYTPGQQLGRHKAIKQHTCSCCRGEDDDEYDGTGDEIMLSRVTACNTGQRDGIDHYETVRVSGNKLDGSGDDKLTSAGLHCNNRDGEADGSGKMGCMSLMAATTTGSPLKALPGHNTVEMTVVRKWALHSQDAIHTMSAHNSDGYGVGSANVSLMSCFVLLCILTCCSVCH